MPGVIVVMKVIEETFHDLNLPCNEELAVLQEGTDLRFNILDGKDILVAKDCLAMLLVVAGIAVHIGKADVRVVRHDAPCRLLPSPVP